MRRTSITGRYRWGYNAPLCTLGTLWFVTDHSFALFQWTSLLPDVAVKPDTHNLFLIRDTDEIYSHLRVTIIPDGGIVRLLFRVSSHFTTTPSPNSLMHCPVYIGSSSLLWQRQSKDCWKQRWSYWSGLHWQRWSCRCLQWCSLRQATQHFDVWHR